MKIDFSDIFKLFLLFVQQKKSVEEVVKTIDKEQNPTPPPQNPPPPVPSRDQRYFSLVAKCFYLEGDREDGSRGPIYDKGHFDRVLSPNASDAQMVGERMHLDCTPFDENNQEIGPDDPRHPGKKGTKKDNQDAMEFIWTYAGKVNTDSQDEPDRFALESSWDDYGMTPVLLLEEGSPGRWPVTFQFRIKPEFNGGVEVKSNIVTWYAD